MKKLSKRTISIALACLLTLALLPASALAAGWQSHWSAEYVQSAIDYGWVKEDADGNIPSSEPVSRADFAVILWRIVGAPDAEGECPFTDVTDEEAKTAIAALSEQGIVEGKTDTSFAPADTLTRQEGLTLLARAFGLTASNPNAAVGYADWADVADWAQDAVSALVEAGIVDGVGGNRLAPAQSIVLGEMCKASVVAFDSVSTTKISADNALISVSTIGFVDTDGAKTSAIVAEYNVDLTGAALGANTFQIWDYGIEQGDSSCEIGSNPGVALKAYVNSEPAVSETGGTGSGKYVIIEVNTDYQFGSVASSYKMAVAADVLQTGTIRTAQYTITPAAEKLTNYTVVEVEGRNGVSYYNYAVDSTYTFTNLEGFELFTKEDGTAFHATDCFEELDGAEYDEDGDHIVDVDLPYALFVPADYEEQVAAGKKFALVIQVHDAGFMGDDPMITLTESQGSANFASDEVQQIVKDQGLGGLIVVAPQIEEALRSTRDNWSLSAAVPATWQLLDELTETYDIDMDHIYGTGQSMGGMQVVAMAAQRDNYFAGVWANGCQWGNNYNLEEPYSSRGESTTCVAAPADGTIIWTKDADGNECDYRNWYYMISDDNVLITNCAGDAFSTKTWQELDFLYQDLTGISEIPKAIWDPLTVDRDEQSAIVKDLIVQPSDTGFYWTAFEGGNHMATWIYSHGVSAHYEWLLTQTRQSEMDRDKLDLDKPFVAAAEQITTEDRLIAPDADENDVYFVTGELGAGTADYNSSWLQMGNSVIKAPNWKPSK